LKPRIILDFLGNKVKDCLDKLKSASGDEKVIEKAVLDLKNHALTKPFLYLIDHAIKQNERLI